METRLTIVYAVQVVAGSLDLLMEVTGAIEHHRMSMSSTSCDCRASRYWQHVLALNVISGTCQLLLAARACYRKRIFVI
jgi:hypothetical protein